MEQSVGVAKRTIGCDDEDMKKKTAHIIDAIATTTPIENRRRKRKPACWLALAE